MQRIKFKRGYSLTEIAIVMVIIGILISGSLSVAIYQTDNTREQQTMQKMKLLEQALVAFVGINKRLPCPADALLNIYSSATYGSENCAGTVSVTVAAGLPSPANNTVMIAGSVPVTALFLPRDFMLDGWGNKFSYAVSKGLTDSSVASAFDTQGEGVIKIKNFPNTAQVTNMAVYVLISHGNQGVGAWSAAGVKNSSGADARKIENSHSAGGYNETFVINTIGVQKSAFNDIVSYKVRQQIVSEAGYTYSGAICNNAATALTDNNSSTTLANKLCNGTGGIATGTVSASDCQAYLMTLSNLVRQRCLPR